MSEAEIKSMSVKERITTMEAIWSTLIDEDVPVESPQWHGSILASRGKKIRAGKAKFISLDELAKYNKQ